MTKKHPPTRRKVGRPRLISDKRLEDFITALQSNANYSVACAYAGISYATFNNWMRRGQNEHDRLAEVREKALKLHSEGKKLSRSLIEQCRVKPEEKPFLKFFKSVNEANAIAAVGWLQTIDAAAQQDPQWAAWQLAKRYPEQYGSRQASAQVSVNTDGEGNTSVNVTISEMRDIFKQMADYERQQQSDQQPG